MKIIIWLGNHWIARVWTRHNVWHMFIDYMSNVAWVSRDIDCNNELEIFYYWTKEIYIKPLWCINESWKFIKRIMNKFSVTNDDLIIIHDDMDIKVWEFKVKTKWWHWWHNWVKDIIKTIWWNFKRIKIWIDRPHEWATVTEHVLWEFTHDEIVILEEMIEYIYNDDII